jgi:predicted AlkP superfamily phosphohydrolase/phosphomutase
LFEKLAAEGDVAYLSELAARSLTAPLTVQQPVVPPVSWTTIATGVTPAEHGILMPDVRRWGGVSSWMQMTPLELAMHSVLADVGFGQRQPVSGYMRKVKAFW